MPVFSTAIRCMNGGSPRFTIDTNLLVYSVDRSNKAAATAWALNEARSRRSPARRS